MFKSLLNCVFTVNRRTRTADNQGGHTIGYSAIGTIEGRIRPASGSEKVSANAEGRQISHVLYTEASVDVERGDQISFGPRNFEVLGIRNPSMAGHHFEIDCMEIQKEVHA
jgi:SPP1 family predicted phage head-tail adaptor